MQGLVKKLYTPGFLDYMEQFDIFLITESWGIAKKQFDSYFPSFQIFDSVRPQTCMFKGHGGIIIGVKHGIFNKVQLLPSSSNDMICVQISGNFAQDVKCIEFLCIYYPPPDSPYANIIFFDVIENDLQQNSLSFPSDAFLIGTDLNARSGVLSDCDIFDERYDDEGTQSFDAGPRFNCDQVIDNRGKVVKNLGSV